MFPPPVQTNGQILAAGREFNAPPTTTTTLLSFVTDLTFLSQRLCVQTADPGRLTSHHQPLVQTPPTFVYLFSGWSFYFAQSHGQRSASPHLQSSSKTLNASGNHLIQFQEIQKSKLVFFFFFPPLVFSNLQDWWKLLQVFQPRVRPPAKSHVLAAFVSSTSHDTL